MRKKTSKPRYKQNPDMKQKIILTKINGTQAVENMADICDISFLKAILY